MVPYQMCDLQKRSVEGKYDTKKEEDTEKEQHLECQIQKMALYKHVLTCT